LAAAGTATASAPTATNDTNLLPVLIVPPLVEAELPSEDYAGRGVKVRN
jgi:hypothetical protein